MESREAKKSTSDYINWWSGDITKTISSNSINKKSSQNDDSVSVDPRSAGGINAINIERNIVGPSRAKQTAKTQDDYGLQMANWMNQNMPSPTELEKYIKEKAPFSHFDEDLMRGTPESNFNGMTGHKTLWKSRLADVMNNKYYRRLNKGSNLLTSAHLGQLGSKAEDGEEYQKKIQTEEMRQAERMRNYEDAIRTHQIDRQQTWQDMPVLLKEKEQLELLRQSGKITDSQIDRLKSIQEALLDIRYRWPAQYQFEINSFYMQQKISQIDIPKAKYNIVQKLNRLGFKNEANLMLNLFSASAQVPSQMQDAVQLALVNSVRAITDAYENGNYNTQRASDELYKTASTYFELAGTTFSAIKNAGADTFNNFIGKGGN